VDGEAGVAASRFGILVEGATVYTAMRPCFGCTKELLQASVVRGVYLHDWHHPNRELQAEYEARWAGVLEVLNFAENYTSRSSKPTLHGARK